MIVEPLNRPSPNPSRIREGVLPLSRLRGGWEGEMRKFAIILTLYTKIQNLKSKIQNY